MQTSAPRSLGENQWPPGRAAELNYRENTVAKGCREGCGIDLSHGGGGVGGSESSNGVRGRANGKQSEEKGGKEDEIGKRSEGEQTAERRQGGMSVENKYARLQGGSAAPGVFQRGCFHFVLVLSEGETNCTDRQRG